MIVFLNECGKTPVVRTRLKIYCNGVRILKIIAFKIVFVNSHLLNEHAGLIFNIYFLISSVEIGFRNIILSFTGISFKNVNFLIFRCDFNLFEIFVHIDTKKELNSFAILILSYI